MNSEKIIEDILRVKEAELKKLLDLHKLPYSRKELRDRGYEIIVETKHSADGRGEVVHIILCRIVDAVSFTMDIDFRII